MTQRKWLAECHAWLDDPGSVQFQNENGNWITPSSGLCPLYDGRMNWRIKPATVMVNGAECPKAIEATQLPTDYCVDIRMWGTPADTIPSGRCTQFYPTEADARKVYEALIAPFGEVK